MIVRYAHREELERVNELREMVNQVHVEGRPDIFRPGFGNELKQFLFTLFDNENDAVIVAVDREVICGFTIAEIIHRPLSPYSLARDYYHIMEFGVDPAFRRRGAATAMIDFCRKAAAGMGIARMELDVWSFNESALAFYESVGFKTFRQYMELDTTCAPEAD